jgi:hypothetical protein
VLEGRALEVLPFDHTSKISLAGRLVGAGIAIWEKREYNRPIGNLAIHSLMEESHERDISF